MATKRLSCVREVEIRYGPSLGEAPSEVRTPSDLAAVCWPLVEDWYREHFIVVLLDGRHQYRGSHLVSLGSQTASLVHPREVFRAAIMAPGTAAIALAHTHPSGDTTPSREDVALTERLVAAGQLLGIPVLDHIIFTEDGAVHSLCESRRSLFEGSAQS